jgi:hypothetical protein
VLGGSLLLTSMKHFWFQLYKINSNNYVGPSSGSAHKWNWTGTGNPSTKTKSEDF